jgi:Beta/Gamma crystallin
MNRSKFLFSCLAIATLGLSTATVHAYADSGKIKSRTNKGKMILYSGQKFQGDNLEITKPRITINEEIVIGSIAIFEGDSWELCEGPRFKGTCVIYSSNQTDLGKLRIMSARPVKAAPAAPPKP